MRRARQNADGAEQMTEDVFALGDIFGFLMQFLHARHMPSLLGLLHAVADKHDPSANIVERRKTVHGLLPDKPQRIQRPRGGTKEMEHRFVVTRIEREIPDDRSYTKMIGTDHQTDNKDNEPLEGGGARETSTEGRQNLIYKFQHGMVGRNEIG